jgi:hypothetical protein
MSKLNCLLDSTSESLKELTELGFSYTLLNCDDLSVEGKYYIMRRRSKLVKNILRAAKSTKNKAYLKLKLRRYKYISGYARLKITL